MRVRGARTRQPVRRVLAETFPGPARPFHNPQMLRFCGCVAPPPPRRRVRSGVYAPHAACETRSSSQSCRADASSCGRALREGETEHEAITKALFHPLHSFISRIGCAFVIVLDFASRFFLFRSVRPSFIGIAER